MQLKPETTLQSGKYKIIKTLGQGGFGITYLAEQVALHRKVAIKEFFMKDCCERDEATSAVTVGTGSQRELVEKFREKFLREALMIAQLDHPNIVRIIDVFEENGTAYYTMDYIIGGSLKELVAENGPIDEQTALKYLREVGDALQYVHRKKILHFDIKPSNIMLRESGSAALIDFGVSKHYDEGGHVTSSTPVGISKGYAPLEQYRQDEISTFTPATDIYALGATLYTLLTGCVPPDASDVYEDGLPELPVHLSESTRNAIEKAMTPRRKDRPQSVAAFLALLDAKPAPAAAAASADPKPTAADSEATVIAPKEAPKPEPKTPPKPAPKPAPKAPASKPAETKKSKTWLWAPLACAAVVAVVAIVLGVRNKQPGQPAIIDLINDEASAGSSAVSTTGSISGHEWVDLGLSVKWATCNVGASSPSDYGSYFAWGETKAKSEYTWSNLKYCTDETGDHFNKYIPSDKPNYWSGSGNPDNKKRLDLSDDAARQNWGGNWRMPTDAEWTELQTKCFWAWTTQGGKNGYKITSKTTGNSIFLPAAGYRYAGSLYIVGSDGYYWSSSLTTDNPYNAWRVYFYSSGVRRDNDGRRRLGFSIRPVTE